MGYRDKTYVIFDGDNDMWAYRYMRGWKANKHIDFDFADSHDLKPLRSDASLQATIKRRLKERFEETNQVIVLIGEHTKNLYMFVRWEIETAQDLDLPIIAVNLSQKRRYDASLCPPIMRDKYIAHVAFKARIIKYALDNFPGEYRRRSLDEDGNRSYSDEVYESLGLEV
jgi:hypothetical protein